MGAPFRPGGFWRAGRAVLLGALSLGAMAAGCSPDQGAASGASSLSTGGSSPASAGGSAGTIAVGATGGTAGSGASGGTSIVTVAGSAGMPPGSDCQTTISGTVTTPAGTLPLYNVMLFVPSQELAPLTEGASCDQCEGVVSGEPVASALSDTNGRFVMGNVPPGENVPLVVQIGKWRREVTLPKVTACVDNPVSAELTRLPKNRAEGHLPRIALSTGGLDALECLLLKIGIDLGEFTTPDEPGRVNLYAGRGGTDRYGPKIDYGSLLPLPYVHLWGEDGGLTPYDIVFLACEGGEFPSDKTPESRARMFDYANQGGRVFFSHYHKFWLEQGPAPFPDVMSFNDTLDDLDLEATVETSFPKGQALADWLVNVGGSMTPGLVPLVDAQNTGRTENPALAQRWVYDPLDASTASPSVKYMTANTPIGAAEGNECGRIVYSDIHVATNDPAGDQSSPSLPFPEGCHTTDITPQEKVLIFMFFDLSACVIPDHVAPMPPRTIVK
jgi:hypothetical protein